MIKELPNFDHDGPSGLAYARDSTEPHLVAHAASRIRMKPKTYG